ncbi:MAG: hypothetical protein F4Y18_03260 [Cenarchaeum sp. SB0663_bin_5]|nr:hypothetical protein [Cenarchaeum sp. SB0663_bin_5]MYH04404.1 hypothetical protein [Cenarchaeum sp. SB0675_bin_21]MYL12098.1 hypothetical protein [Cenarchaeum sp. SB0669_bin_11]
MRRWFGGLRKKNDPHNLALEELLSLAHDDVGSFDMDGIPISLITFDRDRFAKTMGWYEESGSMSSSIDTNLNILSDGLGHTFVWLYLSFRNGKTERILIDASKHLSFFEILAESGILAIHTDGDPTLQDKMMTIQIPQRQRAEDALELIKKGLQL